MLHKLQCFAIIITMISIALAKPQQQVLVTASPFTAVFNTSSSDPNLPSWYVNDHTFIYGPGGYWHVFGITHTEAADPLFEVNFLHATSKDLMRLQPAPFALGSELPETHLWAPHCILVNGTYYMFYCGGGSDRTNYYLQLATSRDLWYWNRVGTLFTAGVDGRDPMVMFDSINSRWIIYYTGTDPDQLIDDVNHVTFCRTSHDLRSWSSPKIVFVGSKGGGPAGGPTESPFVVQRGKNFYLFSGSWASYSDTRVFLALNGDPTNFGSAVDGTSVQVGEIPAHAPEVVRDTQGNWWISRSGWGQGGLYLSQLTWLDNLDNAPTSMPPPAAIPGIPPQFNTNVAGWNIPSPQIDISWVITPSGLQGGCPLDNCFIFGNTKHGTNFIYEADITSVTKDGNPTGSNGDWTRDGSAAAIVFGCADRSNPLGSSYVLNFYFDAQGNGAKFFSFPYKEYSVQPLSFIDQMKTFRLRVEYQNGQLTGYIDPSPNSEEREHQLQQLFSMAINIPAGYVGLNVWQGSAFFNNVNLS